MYIALSCPIKIVFFLNFLCFNKFNSYGLGFFVCFNKSRTHIFFNDLTTHHTMSRCSIIPWKNLQNLHHSAELLFIRGKFILMQNMCRIHIFKLQNFKQNISPV